MLLLCTRFDDFIFLFLTRIRASLVFDQPFFSFGVVCLSLIHSGDGGIKIMLREAGGRRSVGCGYKRLPSFNGTRLLDTDTMDDDHNTNTRGLLDA